jgi:hypothetical protein
LYRHLDTGNGPAACNVLASACNDDGGQGNTNSLLIDTLDPEQKHASGRSDA